MSRTVERVNPAHPHGASRWVSPLRDAGSLAREGAVEVYNAKAPVPHWQGYELREWSDESGPLGYSLSYVNRHGRRQVYDLPAALTFCDCGDAACRDRGPCKHVTALSSLLGIELKGPRPPHILSARTWRAS